MSTENVIAIVFGVAGTVLGIVSLVWQWARERIRIKIVPLPECTDRSPDRMRIGARVVNGGLFPISIWELGLTGTLPSRWRDRLGRIRPSDLEPLAYRGKPEGGYPAPGIVKDPPVPGESIQLPTTLNPQKSLRVIWEIAGDAMKSRLNKVERVKGVYLVTLDDHIRCSPLLPNLRQRLSGMEETPPS